MIQQRQDPSNIVLLTLISCLVIRGSVRKTAYAGFSAVAGLAETSVIGIVGIHMRNCFPTLDAMVSDVTVLPV